MCVLDQAQGVCVGLQRAALYQPGSHASGEQPRQGTVQLIDTDPDTRLETTRLPQAGFNKQSS